jgi:hypothetical protein
MTVDDMTRIAERYSELMRSGKWQRMSDAQKAVQLLTACKALQAALLEVFLVRKSLVSVLVDQYVDHHQTLA